MIADRIGLFGGTFDPVHIGHIEIARGAANALALDRVYFIPCAQHALGKSPGATVEQRLAMLELAIENAASSLLSIDQRELRRKGVSYTIDSCREIREGLGKEAVIGFIIGSDLLDSLHQWQEWQLLLDYVNLIVVDRAEPVTQFSGVETDKPLPVNPVEAVQQLLDTAVNTLSKPAGQVVELTLPYYAVSSTALRQLLRQYFSRGTQHSMSEEGNKLLDQLRKTVDHSVLSYIIENELYKD